MNIFEKGLLRYFSDNQLENIQKYKVGIAGCGGLGSNIANVLVRSGFKKFVLVDYDKIEPSNLNRQNFFCDEIGEYKVVVTKKRLTQINPDVKVDIFMQKITKENIDYFFNDCEIIFEAFDNVKSKKMIFEYFYDKQKILIMGNGMAGIKNTDIKIRKINKFIYVVGDEISNVDASNPPFAPRVVTCASMMASVALEKIFFE